jgi:DNA modification methylase
MGPRAGRAAAGDLIVDPFTGARDYWRPCAKLGRKFIGIAIDDAYFEIVEWSTLKNYFE